VLQGCPSAAHIDVTQTPWASHICEQHSPPFVHDCPGIKQGGPPPIPVPLLEAALLLLLTMPDAAEPLEAAPPAPPAPN